jgi:nucleoside-diphosphate-sugar epimerase
VKVLVTGANGFVGQSLCPVLLGAGHEVVAAIRHDTAPELPAAVKCINVGSLTLGTYWRDALDGVDAIVHLAARTHVMDEAADNPEMAYRQLNVEVTRRLANEAALLGVKRFIFLSSIKVNGERTDGAPFTQDDPAAPEDAYGRTKRDAEIELTRGTEGTSTETCILRAPLVYGPGVKGNFLKLLGAVAAGKLLPLGMIDNRRSLIYVGNLSSAIATALTHPDAAGQIYLVSDGEDLSTAALVVRMAKALGTPPRLLPVPAAILRLAGRLTGRGPVISRLTGSLQVDSNPLRQNLGWKPPFSVDQGLEQTATWYKSRGEECTQMKDPDAA